MRRDHHALRHNAEASHGIAVLPQRVREEAATPAGTVLRSIVPPLPVDFFSDVPQQCKQTNHASRVVHMRLAA